MTANTKSECIYKVEISGWDAEDNFFVELTNLEWNEQNQKTVVLRNCVTTGAMVFLRLAEKTKPTVNLPIALRAGHIQAGLLRNTCEVQLEQLWPWQGEHVKTSVAGSRGRTGAVPRDTAVFLEAGEPADRLIH